MLLFLDVVSPIPEFSIIDDKKVLLQKKIISQKSDKLSDNIFQTYIKLSKVLDLTKNLKKIAITTGPGSYTSLRVGAAFVSGLSISSQVQVSQVSVENIINFKNEYNQYRDFAVYICSSNNQKFFCYTNSNNNVKYIKIEDNNFILPESIKTIFYNYEKLSQDNTNIKQLSFSFVEELINNIKDIKFFSNETINPIYISNNSLLS